MPPDVTPFLQYGSFGLLFLLVAWAVWGVLAIALSDPDMTWSGFKLAQVTFYLPATIFIFLLGAVAWRRTHDRDARIVIAMLWFRWAFGTVAYMVGPMFGVFEEMVWIKTTLATLVSFIVIGTAVLRSELFSLRSAAAWA